MQHILQLNEGEPLKLKGFIASDVVIKVDPRKDGGPFAGGTQSIAAGSTTPVIRHLYHDKLLVVLKGQGRAVVGGENRTIVPGSVIYVPRQIWHGLRNSGTGVLQLMWVVSPPGLEEFFREIANLDNLNDSSVIQAIAQRHGIEFNPEAEKSSFAKADTSQSYHRRRYRRHGYSKHSMPASAEAAKALQPPVTPAVSTASTSIQSQPNNVEPSAAKATPPDKVQARSRYPARYRIRGRVIRRGGERISSSVSSSAHAQQKPSQDIKRARFQRRGRIKEVYMGGRWIQVSGEGPMISPK